MSFQTKMLLLLMVFFGMLFGIVAGIGIWLDVGNPPVYALIAFVLAGIQNVAGAPAIERAMKIRWVSEEDAPELHELIGALAEKARLPKPKVGISQVEILNAFAFGRTQRDGRVCVSQHLLVRLDKNELKAVLAHEISHIKNWDMAVIGLLWTVPFLFYWISDVIRVLGIGMARSMRVGSKLVGGSLLLIWLGALLLHFLTSLLALYGCRIREYYADLTSVRLGSLPHHLGSALYRIEDGNAPQRNHQELMRTKGYRAFFPTDPGRASKQIRDLSEVDQDRDGTISADDLKAFRAKVVRISWAERLMELFSTHPHMLLRMKHLSTLV